MPNITVQKVADPGKMPLTWFTEMQTIFDRIRDKAFTLFAENGCVHGRAVEDWLAAEREVFWVPESELVEKDKEFELRIAAPGFEANDVEVTALPDSIVVRAGATRKSGKAEGTVCFSEFCGKQLYRRFALPAPIEVNKTAATLDKGVLKVTAPKAPQEKAHETEKKISLAA